MSPGELQAGTKGLQAVLPAWPVLLDTGCEPVCLVKQWWREGDTVWRDQEFSRHFHLAFTRSTPSYFVRNFL